jgi:hypothetical protein
MTAVGKDSDYAVSNEVGSRDLGSVIEVRYVDARTASSLPHLYHWPNESTPAEDR